MDTERENAISDIENIERTTKMLEQLVKAGLSEETARDFLLFYL